MLLELRKAFTSVSCVHHFCSPEALFITGGCHLTPGCYVLLLHISLSGLPANESPRKQVNKSTYYPEQYSSLPADSPICWTVQSLDFSKCCICVMLNCCANLFLIHYLIFISSDSLLCLWYLSCCQKLCVSLTLTKRQYSSHSFHLPFFIIIIDFFFHYLSLDLSRPGWFKGKLNAPLPLFNVYLHLTSGCEFTTPTLRVSEKLMDYYTRKYKDDSSKTPF